MNYLKKLTVSAVTPIGKEIKALENGAQVALVRIFGRVEKTEQGTTQFGDYTAFIGAFKAVSLFGETSGEEYRAPKALFPDIAASALEDAFNNAEGNAVEFAIEIGVRRVVKLNAKGEETGAGYEYTMKPLIEIDEASDPLAALEKRALASLPAPKVEEAEEVTEQTASKSKGKK